MLLCCLLFPVACLNKERLIPARSDGVGAANPIPDLYYGKCEPSASASIYIVSPLESRPRCPTPLRSCYRRGASERLNILFDRILERASETKLPQRSLDGIEKAYRVIEGMLTTLRFVHTTLSSASLMARQQAHTPWR